MGVRRGRLTIKVDSLDDNCEHSPDFHGILRASHPLRLHLPAMETHTRGIERQGRL